MNCVLPRVKLQRCVGCGRNEEMARSSGPGRCGVVVRVSTGTVVVERGPGPTVVVGCIALFLVVDSKQK